MPLNPKPTANRTRDQLEHAMVPEATGDGGDGYRTVTICGSMRFFPLMLRVAGVESLEGNIVLMPFLNDKEDARVTGEVKLGLDIMHKAKILRSERIVVVSQDGYIGQSTRDEISYAAKQGKEIDFVDFNAAVLAEENTQRSPATPRTVFDQAQAAITRGPQGQHR